MLQIKLDSALIAVTSPVASCSNTVKGEGFRITILTANLFRVETSKTDTYIDDSTQMAWFRNFEDTNYKIEDSDIYLNIITSNATLIFNKRKMRVERIVFSDGSQSKCNNRGNLLGTKRTLDGNFGIIKLKNGLMSKTGVSVIDDNSLILNNDGEIEERTTDTIDKYIFAYQNQYRKCLFDFYRLTGGVPLIPRFALGNWWSRYRAYTQEEYTELMQRFMDEDIPISVATIDMDWHWVKVNQKFKTNYKGNLLQNEGWTGYSWNTDLFPDYKGFLKWLNENNFKVTVNLHPADGVRSFEDMYPQMAQAMGIDPATKKTIPFDITNNAFINAYFKILHAPYERDGVRFWWLDWQQGKKTKIKGLDPLWSLNHYHTLDNARNGKRPLILSRYAGVGSHRYPLGFSGDTFIYWSSLKLQPYFTNNATNIGYTWWSHDIGGHHFGIRDDEMYLRWLQYGVFSPINRMHSTSSDLLGKEPWCYSGDIKHYLIKFLRLRHNLIPYIYTMNYLTHSKGIALCESIYYRYPSCNEAYKVRNQYFFGSELMVCPITSKIDKHTNMACVKAWLPKGRWTDIFTGQIYNGDKFIKLYRDETSIPVLAKEGAIIPLSNNSGNDYSNPVDLELWIYRGNNTFTLYEDEGEDLNYNKVFAKTNLKIIESEKSVVFEINGALGDLSILPEKRNYHLRFKDLNSGNMAIEINGVKISEKYENDLNIDLTGFKVQDKIRIIVTNYKIKQNLSQELAISNVIAKIQGSNIKKMLKYNRLKKLCKKYDYKKAVKLSGFTRRIKNMIDENLEEI